MKITKFDRIEARTYRNFLWPSDLPVFADYNLIYGWNGTGKTTLADILQMLEKRESTGQEGISDFSITCGPHTITPANITTIAAPPSIRVFNRSFVDRNVFSANGATSIFFIGEEDIEKQKELVKKKEALKVLQEDADAKGREKDSKEKELGKFCQDRASEIRRWLGITSQNQYNQTHFRKDCDDLITAGNASQYTKSNEEISALKVTIGLPAKDSISSVSLDLPDLTALTTEVKTLLQKTVVSQTIAYLTSDPKTSAWVKEGLELHKEHKSENCKFCEQRIPAARLAALEGHFNDEFKALDAAIAAKIVEISQAVTTMGALQLPAPEKFYDDLRAKYNVVCQKINEQKGAVIEFLGQLKTALENKKGSPFAAVTFDITPADHGAAQLDAVNAVIATHNDKTKNFNQVIEDAKKAIKYALAGGAITEYNGLKTSLDRLEREHKSLKDKVASDDAVVNALEQEIINHKKPAEEINKDLKDYLGHSEIRFATKGGETGYTIMRGDKPAAALSEGEKTAIALLHFLKTLEDQKFKLSDGIVVIDDPVCSMDDTSMFRAFSYIQDRTKDAKQLFILTHNFKFFQNVRNWFHHIKPKKAAFYQTDVIIENNIRASKIRELDKLLHDYNSEYHYLFKRTYIMSETTNSAGNLEVHYPMPNIARRLLENFLAFRMPHINDEKPNVLYNRIKSSGFDAAKKTSILRFLNVHSHESQIGYDEHDISILAETPQIMKFVLELIEHEDKKHYDHMAMLIAPLVAANTNQSGPVKTVQI